MKCPNCGKKVKDKDETCKKCGAAIDRSGMRPKANKLGNCALIFAFFIPVVGLILGIVAVCVAHGDEFLIKDGVKAIVMSVIVAAVQAVLVVLIVMLITAAPFIISSATA